MGKPGRFASAIAFALLATPPASASGPHTVRVSSVDQLYAQLDDASNDGARLLLAPGRYVLGQEGRSNLGRLTLRQGMSLVGQGAAQTVIDGAGLLGDDASGAGSRGVIEAGRANRIEGLTVIGNDEVTAQISVGLYPDGGGMSVEIVGCVLTGGRRGVQVVTGGADHEGLVNTVLIDGNVLQHNRSAFGFGVQLLQFDAHGEHLLGTVSNNTFEDNWVGLFLPMLGSTGATTEVLSTGNSYRHNALGVSVIGSRDFGLPGGSGNNTWLTSWNDVIANNTDVLDDGGGAGVFAVAALRDCPPAGAGDSCWLQGGGLGPNGGDVSDNRVHLSFIDARFVAGRGDQNGCPGSTEPSIPARSDLQIFGEFSDGESLAGTGNVATVAIRDSVSDGAAGSFAIGDADPWVPDASGSNRVVVIERDNRGVPAATPYPF
jgi:hypothetical protein